jgi:hypothetical protein
VDNSVKAPIPRQMELLASKPMSSVRVMRAVRFLGGNPWRISGAFPEGPALSAEDAPPESLNPPHR